MRWPKVGHCQLMAIKTQLQSLGHYLVMESEYQTVDDKVLLCEILDQSLEDGQLVLDAGGHDVPGHETHLTPGVELNLNRGFWILGV